MRTFFAATNKIAIVTAIAMLFAVSAMGQIALRKAMDYDMDNKADFTIFRPSSNVWYIKNSSSPTGFIAQQFGLSNIDYPSPGDFDGDSKGDISVWRDTDGVWYRLNSSNSTFAANAFGLTGDEPVARDYDGDGKTDLAVVRRTGGNMIWYVLGSLGSFSATQFGLSTDYTAPGDYDGDGKFDYGVQRPGATPSSQATFYIRRSSDTGYTIINWGLSNDLVVPGDYDGDGKTDLAVLREGTTPTSNLAWYILKSTDGGLIATFFGLTGSDLSTQNDYDGDGKTDISIWRDTTGTFYVLTSSSGFTALTQTQWGLPGDYPVAGFDTH
ncbi:MAG: VCBS repeat-containing protein [Acidobacteria bacterium]|nr:VCBS repeat-containing protein [Acidobacteriota bacterium]